MVDGDEEAKYEGTFPAVVKPTHMENSVGVEMVQDAEEMKEVLEKTWDLYGDTAVVDKFIAGREVRCGTVELEPGVITPLGCIEYKIDSDKIRTYDDKLEGDVKNLKQAASTTSWFIDECEEPKLVKKLQDLAIRVHRVMKSKDFCQIDCR